MMKRSAICLGAATVLTLGVISAATARPGYLQAFKAHYKTAQGKPALNGANCALCHVGGATSGKWNVYGDALKATLGGKNVTDPAKIVAALEAAEKKTNPATKTSFADLIAADKFPGSNEAPGGGTGGGGAMASAGAGEWEPVYNGVNTDGLVKMNQGDWKVQDFILKYTGGGSGWLRSAKQYQNYSAVIVWRFTSDNPAGDAGIFLRAGLDGNPFPSGPQLNLGPRSEIGSISGTTGSRGRGDLIHPTDWNTFQLTVWNGHAVLSINGTPAYEEAIGVPDKPGYIGFQNEGTPFDIAQFWVMPLK